MDIRKADSKGRVTGFEPGELYSFDRERGYFARLVITTPDGTPIEEALRGELGRERTTREQVYDLLYAQGIDPVENDLIEISDHLVEAFIRAGFTAN